MTTIKQIMSLVDAYGDERCSGNEYNNRYAEKQARDAVLKALQEYAPPRQWVGLKAAERKELERCSVYVDGAIGATEAKLKEKNT